MTITDSRYTHLNAFILFLLIGAVAPVMPTRAQTPGPSALAPPALAKDAGDREIANLRRQPEALQQRLQSQQEQLDRQAAQLWGRPIAGYLVWGLRENSIGLLNLRGTAQTADLDGFAASSYTLLDHVR